jgi:hypothetical protein
MVKLASKYGSAKVKYTVKEICLQILDKQLEVEKVDLILAADLIEDLATDLTEDLAIEDLVVTENPVQLPVIEEKNNIRIN